MLEATNMFSPNTTKYYMSVPVSFYEGLKENQILYHDNREPSEEWLAVLYEIFFNKYNDGDFMFFMWKDIDRYHSYKVVEGSEFIMLELEIPNNETILKVSYSEWSSLGMDFHDNACNVEYTNEYLQETFGCDIYGRLELLFNNNLGDEFQYMISCIKLEWVKCHYFIDRVIR